MPLRLLSGAASDTGTHRANNEDAAFGSALGAAVADGVGGGPAGELASAVLVQRLAAETVAPDTEEAARVLVQLSNWDLGWHTFRDPGVAGMATTLTALFVGDDELILAHVGDSRAYRLRDGYFARMTRDDSYVQALVDAGMIDPLEASAHPQRNIVTASLRGGSADSDSVTVVSLEAEAGERWLLCTDGVSDYLPDALLSDLLSAPDDALVVAERIIHTALAAGSHDNVTAVVCDVRNDTAAPGNNDVRLVGAASELLHGRRRDASA